MDADQRPDGERIGRLVEKNDPGRRNASRGTAVGRLSHLSPVPDSRSRVSSRAARVVAKRASQWSLSPVSYAIRAAVVFTVARKSASGCVLRGLVCKHLAGAEWVRSHIDIRDAKALTLALGNSRPPGKPGRAHHRIHLKWRSGWSPAPVSRISMIGLRAGGAALLFLGGSANAAEPSLLGDWARGDGKALRAVRTLRERGLRREHLDQARNGRRKGRRQACVERVPVRRLGLHWRGLRSATKHDLPHAHGSRLCDDDDPRLRPRRPHLQDDGFSQAERRDKMIGDREASAA